MKNHFNIVEYIKLLEKEKILATKGYSLYSENEEENNRLRSYRITLEDQIYYNNRYEYQFLIKGYISEKMSTLAFISVFLKLFRIDLDRLEPIEKDYLLFRSIPNLKISLLSYLKSLKTAITRSTKIVRSRKKNLKILLKKSTLRYKNIFKLLRYSNELKKNKKSLLKKDPEVFDVFLHFLVRIENKSYYQNVSTRNYKKYLKSISG
jgi:hypothetical protein